MKKNFKWWRLAVQLAAGALVVAGGVDLLELTMPVLMIAMILGGAFFCGWICPFGTLQDLVSKLTYKVKKRQMPKPLQKIMAWLRYVLFILSSLLTLDILFAIMNYDAKVNFMSLIEGRSLALGAYIVLGLYLVAAVFFERPFCNYMCPEGAKYGILSTLRPFRIVRNSQACVNCDQCNKACPMQIDVAGRMNVTSPQCIDCFSCIAACPKKDALGYKLIKLNWKTGILYIMAIVAATGLGLTAMAYSYNQSQAEAIEAYENQIIASYTEESTSSESISDTNETNNATENVETQVIESAEVIETTSQPVTTSSVGAATSSVDAATSNVKSTSTTNKTNTTSNTTTNTTTTSQNSTTTASTQQATTVSTNSNNAAVTTAESAASTSQGAGYKDGVYTGEGEGFRGTMTVSVTISGGNIVDIEMVSTNDDRKWLNRAWSIVPDLIMQNQSADVDTVSGATYSSVGIIEAVRDALSQAK